MGGILNKKCGVVLKWGWLPDKRFNKTQLKAGIKVEKEHSNKVCIAKQIAKSHLVEDPKYYIKLRRAKL